MIKFFRDIVNFTKIKKFQKTKKYCFFVENQFIYQYLKPYIQNKKDLLVIVSFEKLLDEIKEPVIILETFFFRALFFLTLKFKILITSTPDLNNSIFKRSKFLLTKYIYIQHSPLSLTRIYNKEAFLAFDIVQTVNSFQYNELQKINLVYNKKIKAFKSNYLFLKKKKQLQNKPKKVLIAPTWHTNFYKLGLHTRIIKLLNKNNINYSFRPHPMSFAKKEISKEEIGEIEVNWDLRDELNFSSYSNLISDWSGIFLEFALTNKTFPILLNTEQKIRNKDNLIFKDEPIETVARKTISHCLETNNIDKITGIINNDKVEDEANLINEFQQKYFY